MLDIDIPRDLAKAWRIAALTAAMQLAGVVAFLLVGWPQAVRLTPGAPPVVLQTWFGAVFLTPIGFALGVLWQRAAGSSAPRAFVALGALASVVLVSVAIALLV